MNAYQSALAFGWRNPEQYRGPHRYRVYAGYCEPVVIEADSGSAAAEEYVRRGLHMGPGSTHRDPEIVSVIPLYNPRLACSYEIAIAADLDTVPVGGPNGFHVDF